MRLKIALSMLLFALLACNIPGSEVVDDVVPGEDSPTAETGDAVEEDDAPADGDAATDPTPEPTAAPTATPEPTAAPAEAAFPGANNNCSHPYFPIVEGATYTYVSTVSGTVEDPQTIVFTDVSEESFVFNMVQGNTELTSEWLCLESGLQQANYADLLVGEVGMDFEFQTISAEGLTFPDEFEVGTTWQTFYEISFSTADTTYEGEVTIDYEYVADEEITVPAGTFTAARVESEISILLPSLTSETTSVPVTAWYAEGVGLLRDVAGFAGLEAIRELETYNIPAE